MVTLHVLSLNASLSENLIVSSLTDTMLPSTALRGMSWALLSCMMLLSQVQGEISLVQDQNQNGTEGSFVSPVVTVGCTPQEKFHQVLHSPVLLLVAVNAPPVVH